MEQMTLNLNISYVEAISARYATLNSIEKKLADYILKNPEACIHLSARELGEICDCSAATVVRFAKRLNYLGYPDLKHHIRSSATKSAPDDLTLSSGEEISAMLQKASMFAAHSLQATVSAVDEDTLDRAARLILDAHTVQLCAIGSASGVALAACSQFLSFGIGASFPLDELQQLRSAACLRPGDVLIGINYNNAAKNVADAFMAAKKAGATTILITAVRSGILSKYADMVFFTPTRRPNNALNISTSTLCQSMVLQLLILRLWQLSPTRFETQTKRISSYTKMKLYDPSVDKLQIAANRQDR